MPNLGLPTVVGTIAVLLAAPPAFGQGTGGAASPAFVEVTSVRCVPSPAAPCGGSKAAMAGGTLRIAGRGLLGSRSVVFHGARGRADDAVARIGHRGPRHAEVRVPVVARTGPVRLRTEDGGAYTVARRLRVRPMDRPGAEVFFLGDRRRPGLTLDGSSSTPVTVDVLNEELGTVVRRISAPAGATAVSWDGLTADGQAPPGRYRMWADGSEKGAPFALVDHVFPIRGKHDLGQSATNNFGGGRGHRGQDMFAACGTRLVAARGGKVRSAGYNGAAGNYVVITSGDTGLDYVYMHMRDAPLVRMGDTVSTRQRIGVVGDSGNASGCHLHFELWDAPGWYAGGSAFDPLPLLRLWDEWS